MTGRAGRALVAGRGFVQTYMPEHPVMQAIISGDREAFLEREIRQRQVGAAAALWPARRAHRLGARQGVGGAVRPRCGPTAPAASRIEVLGPAEAPLAVIRGRHRWRLLVKAPRELDLQAYLRAWLGGLPKLPSDLRLTVDIDPYSFL